MKKEYQHVDRNAMAKKAWQTVPDKFEITKYNNDIFGILDIEISQEVLK
jgi:hypothetical protein